jgi:DNA-binding SARP family transcriptional activator
MPPLLVLGPLEVHSPDGVPIRLTRRKLRELLALLLLRPGTTVDFDEIVDVLWGEHPPTSARANLNSYVWDLRRVLARAAPADEPRPSHTRNGYRLELRTDECDAYLFEELATTGRQALKYRRYAEAAECLAQALGLWRGQVLRDIAAEFCTVPAARLDQARLRALEDYANARLSLGQHEDLAIELAAAVRRYPLCEHLWAQFMVALYRAGRRTDALRAYHEGRDVLDAELGIGPGMELRTLHRAIVGGHRVW